MKYFLLLFFITSFTFCNSQSNSYNDKQASKNVLEKQRLAWSQNNLEAFMDTYWKSDSLKFYGSNGVTYGWKNTLERYKKTYPTKAYMGKLDFKINDISKISTDAYFVLGKYYLKRDLGNASGIFMLVLKKINGSWKIIADTSCQSS